MKETTQIENYKKEELSFKLRNGKVARHDVCSIGEGDKVVIIIQELPGIGQETLALAVQEYLQRCCFHFKAVDVIGSTRTLKEILPHIAYFYFPC